MAPESQLSFSKHIFSPYRSKASLEMGPEWQQVKQCLPESEGSLKHSPDACAVLSYWDDYCHGQGLLTPPPTEAFLYVAG